MAALRRPFAAVRSLQPAAVSATVSAAVSATVSASTHACAGYGCQAEGCA